MHRQRSSKAPSNPTPDEFDLHLSRIDAAEGSHVTDGISERTPRPPQPGHQRTRDRNNDATARMITRNILSKQPSAPVVNTERVEAEYSMSSSAYFSTSRVSERLGSLPTTPPKKTRSDDPPPSTARSIRTRMDTLGFSTPSKKEKEISRHRSDSGQKKIIFIDDDDDDDDDDDECEVNNFSNSDYFSGFEPPPSPESASSLVASRRSGSATTSSSSQSSAVTRQESSSWDSVEMPPASTAGRKRARPSDTFDAEAAGTNSGYVDRNVLDVFSAPRISKARKADRESSPKKSSLETKPITIPVPNNIPPSIAAFFRDPGLGRALPPRAIAYDHEAQVMMDSLGLAWGVQYELARGITSGFWTWEKVREVLHNTPRELQGSNSEAAPKVSSVMKGHGNVRDTNAALWEELDREQAALLENKGRGLGLMGSWRGEDNWFGGQIQQVARLKSKDSLFVICLDAMEKRRSHRFSRFCGSRRILQLRIHKDFILKEGDALKRFLEQKFILCGRIFIPFHVKENSLYMVETNEDWKREPSKEAGDHLRFSFSQFINWHNPPEYNYKQALSKYVTRFALGLSTSVPVLEFGAQNIFFIDDIYGSEYQGGRKASAEETMTDGCGFINQAALRAINNQLNKRSLPVAVQGRIAGAKGLWILHPDDTSPEYKIWIRESQNKIKYTQLHRAHRIFELVATSQPSTLVSISTQPIVNLAYNNVPHETLLRWLERGLVEEIQPLIDWDRPHSAHLWHAIYKAGSIGRSRLARMTVGFSRAKGLTKGSWKDDEIDQILDVDAPDDINNTFGARNEYSKAPFAASEFAIELYQAGFHPRQSTILKDKLNYIIEEQIKHCVNKYSIPLPESLSGFVIPDPLGTLDEGEIYYRSSESLLNPQTQLTFDTVEGDVILGRYPVRLASDLQKVRAVNKPELYKWPDVIIVSTKGTRSLASLLSGGDMDGDTLFMLREPDIVEPFRNQPFVPPPEDLYTANFERHVELVDKFCERHEDDSPADQQAKLQSALLLTLSNDCKGLYSVLHDYAIEKYGYNDPRAIRLAYIFNTLLDASKSGLILADGIFKQDYREYARDHDSEQFISAGQNSMKRTNIGPPVRPTSDAFILAELKKAAEAKGEELREKFRTNSTECEDRIDRDLKAPYEHVTKFLNEKKNYAKYPEYAADLQKIRDHVHKAYGEYLKVRPKQEPKKSKSKLNYTSAYVAGARVFAEPVAGLDFISLDQAEELKASYAYVEYHNFNVLPFQLAFQKLCEIKARKPPGGIVACTREIDEMKAIPRSHIRAVERSYCFDDSDGE